ncbi:YcjX family protein [Thalassotalea aquiviva]|uniref:YcjX family protein n=1 Tax=Thalassotalea aquiviva TaxID=3242415 RepID=UPI00352AAE01
MAVFSSKSLVKFKDKIESSAKELFHRSLDQHVKLAVTGLSQSGKTAFITSLVNQLINEGRGRPLPFFDVVQQGRFIAAKRVPQNNLHIPRFSYDLAIENLSLQPPQWPEATRSISELRLAIRYYPQDSLLKYATEMATLYLDITDYPGEWLLDLPMLEQNFEQWSEQMTELLNTPPRNALAQPFLDKVALIDPFAVACENQLAELADEYTQLLHQFRHELGLSVIQPGRFILPGEHEGAPILQFIPFPYFSTINKDVYQQAGQDTFIGMLKARYKQYCERIVRQFYKQHFVHFDRQIVLADCLTPLNHGTHAFKDLQKGLNLIMKSFAYGKSNVFTRLFSPKIDKLLFAATKADHVTAEQHPALTGLLEQLLMQAKQNLSFDAIKMKSLTLASVRSTMEGETQYQGHKINVLKGRRLDNQQVITVFPGKVPSQLPEPSYFEQQPYNFIAFSPLEPLAEHQALDQINMDKVLQYLLGDKLK